MTAAIFELRQEAGRLRKNGEVQAALELFQQLWEQHFEACNGWDGWGYAWCLYKQQRYAEALKITQQARDLDADLSVLKSLQAWSLYQSAIKPEVPLPRFQAALQQILNLSTQADPYSPLIATVFRAVEVFAGKPEDQLHYLGFLDPEALSQEHNTFTDAKGKSRQLPSDWLRYWGKWTEALFQLGEYTSCQAHCQEILADHQLPPAQRIWFQRRLARTWLETGNLPDAIALYQEILQRKHDWFIKKELAEALLKQGNTDAALQVALEAALSRGDDEKKLNLYLLLAHLLSDQLELARQHRQYVIGLRQARQWSIPQSLRELAAEPLPDLRTLKQTLLKSWQALLPDTASTPASDTPRQNGQILRLLPHGKAGFLRPHGSKDNLYFEVRAFQGDPQSLKPGLHVSFDVRQGFDAKKQKPALQAVRLQVKKSESD